MRLKHVIIVVATTSIMFATPAVSIGFGAVLAIASTVVGVAQGVVAGKANEKAAIAQQKTFEAMFLSVREVNTKLDGVLAELYQIAEDIDDLPVKTATVIVTNQLLGNSNAVSKEVVSTTRNSLKFDNDRIIDAKDTLRQLRTDLNVLIEQAKVLPSEERRSVYSTIALAEEVFLSTYLAADYLSSAEYLNDARMPDGDLEACDPTLIEDLTQLGVPLDGITCDPSVERSEIFIEERERKEDDFQIFWRSELVETGALALDIRKYFPGSNTPQVHTQSIGYHQPGVAGVDSAPTFPERLDFPSLSVRPGDGTLPIFSVRSLIADHVQKYAPELATASIPFSEQACGIVVPWVDEFDLSSRDGWNQVAVRPNIASPLAIGWAIGNFNEGQNFDSHLMHESLYTSWFSEEWSKNLETILVSNQPITNIDLTAASLTWERNADRSNALWPKLDVNIPECSGLPVYVTYFKIGTPIDYQPVSDLCRRFGVSEQIVKNGWCERDVISRDHDFYHPIDDLNNWQAMRSEYFGIVKQQALNEIASGRLRNLVYEQFVSTTGSLENGWAFPFERTGPYFPSIVGRWTELSERGTESITKDDVVAVRAISDISAYLAAQQIYHQRNIRR